MIKDDEVSGAYLGRLELKGIKLASHLRACHA